MDADIVLEKVKSHFLNSGFNLTLTIDPLQYNKAAGANKKNAEDFLPEAKSIILVGFAGKEFWSIFQNYLQSNPEFKTNNIDLIDNYTILKFNEASRILDSNNLEYESFHPFGENAIELNFLKLAELGGAGVPSLLGLLLHPAYGTWISLRGAFITNLEPNQYDRPIHSFDPCPTCDKPCISACPAHTISESGWDWEACMKFRLDDITCAKSCASRLACPYGQEQQYPADQLHYHHKFVLKSVKEYFQD